MESCSRYESREESAFETGRWSFFQTGTRGACAPYGVRISPALT